MLKNKNNLTMANLDWVILASYILLIIAMSWWIGQRQKSQEDYYLAGRRMGSWPVALSIMATQVSAISLIGAPAFVALRPGGGLTWLQYEFAIPLAMIVISFVLIPLYHKARGITIYEYLQKRFGIPTRTSISAIFLISRGLGSGVALLATAIVTTVCLNWPLWQTILLIGLVSIIYTTFGGIVADIYSDIIQLIILWLGSFIMIYVLFNLIDPMALHLVFNQPERLHIFDFKSSGLGDGQTFSFWAMLCGGIFLYVSYYGCDQSQAQRLLTTPTIKQAQKAMVLNGIFRFTLVLTYCSVGVLLIPFLLSHPDFNAQLAGKRADFLVPLFMVQYIPKGILGLVVSGFFAASMSSIDSALNSLSAASYRDFLVMIFPGLDRISDKQQVRLSRLLTIFWGATATGFALLMIGGSETVLELVNKIGSAFYGPVLAVFMLGMLSRRTRQQGVLLGLVAGVGLNIYLWQFHGTTVSWMWWNVLGFAGTFVLGYAWSVLNPMAVKIRISEYYFSAKSILRELKSNIYFYILLAIFILILIISFGIERYFMTV
jgi:SSS family transporter